MNNGKLLIVSGPSGSGKTTIVHHLLKKFPALSFSVSATTRTQRVNEVDGKDYHFLPVDVFKEKIQAGEFVEWEEVYHGMFYGTLKSEIEKNREMGNTLLFDVDVVGALNLKKKFPERSLAMIVIPPSPEHLENRLKQRKTETSESLERRLGKAEEEMKLGIFFDVRLVNDKLEDAFAEAEKIVGEFLRS